MLHICAHSVAVKGTLHVEMPAPTAVIMFWTCPSLISFATPKFIDSTLRTKVNLLDQAILIHRWDLIDPMHV